MSLKLKPINTFPAKVSVKLADGAEGDFKAEFKYLNRTQLDELLAEQLPDTDFIDRVLVGVTGIVGEDNQPVASDVAKEAIKANIAMTGATVVTFLQTLGGAPAKNSRTSPGR